MQQRSNTGNLALSTLLSKLMVLRARHWLIVAPMRCHFTEIVDENKLELFPTSGEIIGGGVTKIADRTEFVRIGVRNGNETVECEAEALEMPDNRNLVIGLPDSPQFGFTVESVPIRTPSTYHYTTTEALVAKIMSI